MWEGGRWEQSAPLLVLPLTVEQAALSAPTNKAKVLENEEFFRIAWEYQFDTAEMPHSNTVTRGVSSVLLLRVSFHWSRMMILLP